MKPLKNISGLVKLFLDKLLIKVILTEFSNKVIILFMKLNQLSLTFLKYYSISIKIPKEYSIQGFDRMYTLVQRRTIGVCLLHK